MDKKNKKKGWSTRDLLVTVVLGLAFGVLLIPVTNLYAGLRGLGLLAQTAVGSLYFLPVAFAAYVMRKPGTILLISFVSGLILLTTPYAGYALLIEGLTGLIAEVVFWIVTRHKNYGWARFVLACMVSGILEFFVILRSLGSTDFQVGVLILGLAVSGIAFTVCGILAKTLAESLVKTGVLVNTPLGRSVADEI